MKNFKQPGEMLTVNTPAGGYTSGSMYSVGSLVGIAALTTVQNESNELKLVGVFKIPKAAATAITQGAPLYSAFTSGVPDAANTTATSRTLVGWAYKAAASDDTHVEVLLPLGPGTSV